MTTAPDATPIKGSWEERLQTAQQMAANRNDACIDIYDMLVTRLTKMSKVQRQAANGRLQNILMQAAVDLHSYSDHARKVHQRAGGARQDHSGDA